MSLFHSRIDLENIDIGMCKNEFVEEHNRAALSASERIAGRSKEVIVNLLAALD